MAARLMAAIGFWILACAIAAAADFWETKPFTMWTDKEVQRVATNSPWARSMVVTPPAGLGNESERPAAEVGGRGSGGGQGTGGGGGRGGNARFRVDPARLQLVVMWQTALPLKQAQVRQQTGASGTIPAASEALLQRQEASYVIALAGLPTVLSVDARVSMAPENMKAVTSLKAGNKPPTSPDTVVAQVVGDYLTLTFAFARSAPIVLADKDVVFVTKIGPLEIKQKFTLKDMVFRGRLEL